MMELVYPEELAPVVPPFSLGTPEEYCRASEWFPVVEPSGLVTGRATRKYCHCGAKPLHPVYKAWSIVMDGHSYFLFTDTTFTNEENLCCCTLDRIRSLSFIGCHLITTFVT